MQNISVEATTRTHTGTGNSRYLRKNGLIPAVVYGYEKPNMLIAIKQNDISKLYKKATFTSITIDLHLEGKQYKILPKAVQTHPVSDIVTHVDFIFLDNKIQKVDVPIIFENKERAVGVKKGGFFNIIFRKIQLLCPVDNIIQTISIDVGHMNIGTTIKAQDLVLPEGINLGVNPHKVIASITGKKSKDIDTEKTPETAVKK